MLGFAQLAVTALAALVAALAVGSASIPAISGGVLAWAVAWFILGYALYAMAYGALGSLASRTDDAATAAAPVSYGLSAAYFATFVVVTGNPDSVGSKLLSLFPATAPFALPGRIAIGAAAWWEPIIAAALTIAAIAGLVLLAGRVYTAAVLHSGPRLSLKAAWRGTTTTSSSPAEANPPATRAFLHRARAHAGGVTTAPTDLTSHRLLITILTGIAIALGVTVAILTRDVILGAIAGAGFLAITIQMVKLWTGHRGRPIAHH